MYYIVLNNMWSSMKFDITISIITVLRTIFQRKLKICIDVFVISFDYNAFIFYPSVFLTYIPEANEAVVNPGFLSVLCRHDHRTVCHAGRVLHQTLHSTQRNGTLDQFHTLKQDNTTSIIHVYNLYVIVLNVSIILFHYKKMIMGIYAL